MARKTRVRSAAPRAIDSPRLAALRARLVAGDRRVLDQFWAEVAEHGAPLIEAGAEPNESLVTFVFRGSRAQAESGTDVAAAVRAVRLVGGPAFGGERDFALLDETDLWFTSYRLPNDLRTLYKLSVSRAGPMRQVAESIELDPLNSRVFHTEFANSPGWSDSVLELPGAAPQPWVEPRPGVPGGSISSEVVPSAITGHERRLWIYTPSGYEPERGPYPLLVLLDGQAYVACGSAPTTLDNLIAAGRIPPLVTVMVSIPEHDPEARLELYACSDRFNRFLAHELMPLIRSRVHVTIDPHWSAIGGSSLGGLAAAYAGLELYFLFGNVLSQSGSFWWAPQDDREHEWLTRQYATERPRPVRFFLSVGLLETDSTPGNGPSQVVANRHLRDVLRAGGYPASYAEYMEGHNFLSWRGSLADGLIALFGQVSEQKQ